MSRNEAIVESLAQIGVEELAPQFVAEDCLACRGKGFRSVYDDYGFAQQIVCDECAGVGLVEVRMSA
jgi:DnaJ-class molecular chaperone